MRKALEELLDAVECAIKSGDWKVDGACDPDSAIVSAKKALAQSEQDPVAWGVIASNTGKMCQVEFDYNEVSDINSKWLVPLYTNSPQQKE